MKKKSSMPERWVVNLSSKMLTTSQMNVLAKGLNFAPAPRSIPVKEIVLSTRYERYHRKQLRIHDYE